MTVFISPGIRTLYRVWLGDHIVCETNSQSIARRVAFMAAAIRDGRAVPA